MTLNTSHLLTLLSDILDEHQTDLNGEVAEYQQIKRLVKTMIAQNHITDEQLQQMLPEIYNYGIKGETVQNMQEHIDSNKNNIEQWLQTIDRINLE
ncbi:MULTISPECIES: YtzH-like family protein [unclassified Virgibacillus]|uniref:YtzH-like family protein n=1 Tax=unclassified Virgibacillus TaxID=2620237 RepID=UPI0024DE065C|nr:YtzH-like family protein [Virgibacillus sp. LDC-1]